MAWLLMAISSAAWAQGPMVGDDRITIKGLGEIGYTQLFEARSEEGESLDAFALRIAPQFTAFSQKTGFEACGVLAKNETGYGIVVGTNHSHIVCLNFPDKVPAGMGGTGLTMHSHPGGRYYKVNPADRVMLGPLNALNSRVERGPRGLSKEDFQSGAGYLVEDGEVIFQEGPQAVRRVR